MLGGTERFRRVPKEIAFDILKLYMETLGG